MTQTRLHSVLTGMVDAGELTQTQADLIISAYLTEEPQPETLGIPIEASQSPEIGTKRKWLGELGGYIGGVFTLTAGFILLASSWSSISRGGKIGILAALAAILFGAGMLINDEKHGDVRRRLAGTLIGFGAISAAAAGGTGAANNHTVLVASLVGFAIAFVGYWRARSASSHLALFGFFALLATSLFASAHVPRGAMALVVFAVGAAWFWVAYRDLISEKSLGLIIGTATTVIGAEFAFIADSRVIAYILLAAIAAVGFRLYLTTGDWPPLAGAVAATTLGVGQVVGTTLGGALGGALGLLTAGLALLALSAWVLRRRK